MQKKRNKAWYNGNNRIEKRWIGDSKIKNKITNQLPKIRNKFLSYMYNLISWMYMKNV